MEKHEKGATKDCDYGTCNIDDLPNWFSKQVCDFLKMSLLHESKLDLVHVLVVSEVIMI